MNSWFEQEALLRLIPFFGVFVLLLLWETGSPRRPLSISKAYRWTNNLAIVVLNSLLLRLIFPAAAVGVALLAQTEHWGLLQQSPLSAWPLWLKVILGMLILDFIIWGQHLIFHKVPVLWRLHRMHHADLDIDVTTGLRFHPLEILLSMGIKAAAIVLLGIPAIAVLLFEILLNATSMFNHSNVNLPTRFDRWLRLVVVTPDMHRVHHSWHRDETDSNYGFNLPWWDRLLGTYRAQPRDGHRAMVIGLHSFRNPQNLRLDRLLLQPFTNPVPDDSQPGSGKSNDSDPRAGGT